MGRSVTRWVVWGPHDMAADEDSTTVSLFEAESDRGAYIEAIRVSSHDGVTAADTNYTTYEFLVGSDTVATYANGDAANGTSLTKGQETALSLTAAYRDIPASGRLTMTAAKTGNGLAVGGFRVRVKITEIPTV